MRQNTALLTTALVGVCLGGFAPGARAQTASVNANWAQQSPATSPSLRELPATAYDAANGTVVLFGGYNGSSYLGDTWTWNGTTWAQSTATGPSPRYGATMAYDAANGTVVLFGGVVGGELNDTWVWNGTTWTQQSPGTSPTGRYGATMVYDAAIQSLVLFGGSDGSPLNDTWVWNGTTWAQQTMGSSPTARGYAAMAYDAANGTVVLFGGYSGSSYLGDTWTWNGTWTQQTPATSPSGRELSGMAYDAASENVVLFGGSNSGSYLGDTWIWNETTWTQQTTATSPSARGGPAMAYDVASGSMVLFGGNSGSADLADTWTYSGGVFVAPSTAVGTAAAQTPVTFTIGTAGTLGTTQVLTQGATGLDFTLGTGSTCTGAVTSGSTCHVNVAFTPTTPGLRMGAVELRDSNNNVIATAYISGTGTGPLVSYTPGAISTVAGSGTACSPATATCGDGGSATASSADLNGVTGVAVDAAGNLYMADFTDNRIRKVTAATGILSTVAGNGTVCATDTAACGDGGAATSANLYSPAGLALDGAGNLYIADELDNRIRKVTASTGIITTVAGSGTECSSPTAACGDGSAATGAEINDPEGVTVDGAGNLYIADGGNNRIREVPAATGIITTVAGSGTACSSPTAACGDGSSAVASGADLHVPFSVELDGTGNLYIADELDNRIRKVTASTGILSTVAGSGTVCSPATVTCGDGGAATAADISGALYTAVDSAGDLYIADTYDSRVRKVTAATGIITTIAGTGTACSSSTATCGDGGAATGSAADLHGPGQLALDTAGNLYIADIEDNRIRKVTAAAAPVTFATATNAGTTDTTDGSQTILLNNIGNAALTFPIPTSGTNPSLSANYTLSNSSTCPDLTTSATAAGTLAPGTCTAVLSFTPVMPSTAAGALIFNDNSLNNPYTYQNVTLAGTATAATGTTAQTITFPQPATLPQAGTTATLTASSNSGLAIVYSVVSGPAEVSGSTVTYYSAGTVVLEADQYGNNTYAPAAPVQVTVTVADLVGTAASQQTVFVNIPTGGTLGAVYVLTTGQPNLDFTLANSQCAIGVTYAANSACSVNYTFTPKAPGQRLGAVQLVATDGVTILGTTLLVGTGTGSAAVFPGNTSTTALGSGFSYPQSIAVDAAGDVFVADTNNNAVEEIAAGSGSIKTLGSNLSVPEGVAVDGAGNVYVTDYNPSAVKEIVAVGGVTSSSSTVRTLGGGFRNPYAVAVDGAGNVYVADSNNSAIKQIPPGCTSTGCVATLGGGFSFPQGVGVDGAGNVYVADTSNSLVKEIEAVGGSVPASNPTILTLGSGFISPAGVTVDGAGDVYVADAGNNAVKEIEAVGGSVPASNPTILTLGSGFSYPGGVAVDGAGNVYVADTYHSLVKEIPLAVPPSLSFQSTAIGSTSADSPKSLLLENVGNAALTFPIPGMSTNPGTSTGYLLTGSSTCPQLTTASSAAGTLAEGGLCTDVVEFSPAIGQVGTVSGQLVLNDNAPNANLTTGQTITLTGTGFVAITTPTVTVSSLSAVAGSNTALTATVAYAGGSAPTGAFTFTVGSGAAVTATCNGSATPETCTASYPTTGLTAGNSAISASLAADSNYNVATGTGTLTVVPGSFIAPPGSVGTPNTQTATVVFTSGGTLEAINVVTQGTVGLDFNYVPGSMAPNACAVGTAYTAGQSCTVAYSFTPLAPGQRLGGIELYDGSSTPVLLGSSYIAGVGESPQGLFTLGVTSNVAAGLNGVRGVSVDAAGNIYASEQGNFNVDKFAAHTGVETVLTSLGGEPSGTAVDGLGNVYFGSDTNDAIYEFVGGAGNPVTIATGWVPDNPLLVDAAGDLFSPDLNTRAIYEIAAGTRAVTTILPAGQIGRIIGMAIDSSGNLYAADYNNSRMYEIAAGSGTATLLFSGNGLDKPEGAAIDAAGNLYVTNGSGDGNVQRYAAVTYAHTELPTGYASVGIAIDSSGDLLTLDGSNIERYTRTSTPALSFPSTAIGAVSADQVTGFENDGNQPLSISAVYTTSNFSLNATDLSCAANQMAIAATCNLAADLTPHTVGAPLTGSLIVTDNTLNVPMTAQAVALSGTATQATAAIAVASGSVAYGTASVNLSATLTFVSSLTPTGAFTFAVASGVAVTANCAPATSTTEICTAAYPTAALPPSSYTITATLVADANYAPISNTGTLTVQATTPTIAVASLSAVSGSSPALSATVTYSGAQPSGAVTFTVGTGAAVTASCTASGGSETCTAAYPSTGLPLGANTITAALAADSNYTTASGTGMLTLVAGSFTAPTEPVGTISPIQTATVVFTSAGTPGTINVVTQGQTGYDYNVAPGGTCSTSTNYTVGQSCTVNYTFKPLAPGVRQGAVVLTSGTTVLGTSYLGGTGTGPLAAFTTSTPSYPITGLNVPHGTAIDVAGNVYVSSIGSNTVMKYAPGSNTGTPVGSGYNTPTDVAIDGAGTIYVADFDNNRIVTVTTAGVQSTLGTGYNGPAGLAVDGSGYVYDAEYCGGGCAVRKILATAGPSGTPTILANNLPAANAQHLALDPAGNIYVATGADGIYKVPAGSTGGASAVQVTYTGYAPGYAGGISIDAAGNIYIADQSDTALYEVLGGGSSATVVASGFSPFGITAYSGNIYFTDQANGRIGIITRSAGVPIAFANTAVGASSAAQSLTVENDGNAALTISSIAASNSNFGFVGIADGSAAACGSTLATGTLCGLDATFMPTTAGALSGTGNVTDNSLNVPGTVQTVDLTGTSTAGTPVVTVSNQTIGYGTASTTLSAAVAYTGVVETGVVTFQVDAGTIVAASCTGTSSPETCTATYSTSALAPGAHTITATVATDANYASASKTATLTVTAVTPAVTVSPVTIGYGTATSALSATVAYSGVTPTAAFTFQLDSGATVTASCNGAASPETCSATYTTSALTAGPHTITGVLAGNVIYPTASGTAALTVSAIAPTMAFTVPNHSYGDAPFTVAASSNSTGAFTYTVVSGPATISGGTVSLNGIGMVTLQASQAADPNYGAQSKQASFNVSAAGLTVTANSASRFYGAANPTFTGAVTGQVYNDTFTESFASTATVTSPVGSYSIVPSAAGANLGDYTVTAVDGMLSVTKAPTTVNLAASVSNIEPNQTVTLTASVASTTTGTPTGTVSFFDNGTLLATQPLTGGVAMETTALAAGATHILTASYSGDTNFLASATAAGGVAVTVGPLAFTFTTTCASVQTVAPGHTATYSFAVSPTYGAYAGPLSFSVSGLPAGATATFTPSTIPTNGGAQAVTMTVQTSAPIAHNQPPAPAPGSPFDRGMPLLALLLLPALGSRKLRRHMGTSLVFAALLLGGLGATAALSGCGSGNGFLLQQPATNPLTVTATAGTVTESQSVTLIVQ